MIRHRDLIGVELHNARISIEAPTRQPRYVGETVFDGNILWVANGTTAIDWRRAIPATTIPNPPLSFSWSLNLSALVLPSGSQISLYYRPVPTGSTWALLRRYVTGTDLPVLQGSPNGAIALNSWIEQRGLGLYMPLLVNAAGAAIQTRIDIRSIFPEGSVTIASVGRWAEPATSRVYENAQAFSVGNCLAAFVGDVLQAS
ncbi:MAG: hypothetical protein HC895_13835 [Leptolyngbyaceae cyanobacterium SM1_3_5]|nr:hypothetical protein [Leptolyngbyaceae cyanobacterium SM1_3_5]